MSNFILPDEEENLSLEEMAEKGFPVMYKIMTNPAAREADRIAAFRILADRVYGRPSVQDAQVEEQDTGFELQLVDMDGKTKTVSVQPKQEAEDDS